MKWKNWPATFFELFQSKGVSDPSFILSRIPIVISDKENEKLTGLFTEEEVILTLKDMTPTKASTNDCFPTFFFQTCWSILDVDIIEYCLGILNNGLNFDKINSTSFVLILKIPHPSNLFNFRLCAMLYIK